MIFEAAKKKLERYGFTVAPSGNSYSHRYLYYCATKGEQAITFKLDTSHDGNAVVDIKVSYDENCSVKMSSLSAAIRETGNAKVQQKKLDPSKDRIRILHRHGRGLRVSDDEIYSLGIYSLNIANNSMTEAFPILSRHTRRETYKGRDLRNRLHRRIGELWERVIQVHKLKNPDQAPLRRVQVTTQVDKPEGVNLDYYQNTSVSGDMAIFAWDSREATQTVRMMLGEFATAKDLGVVAIGDREKALAVYSSESNLTATHSIKNEIRRVEDDLRETTKRLENLKARLEFSKKKMEIASFIDGIASMTSMLEGAG